MGVWQKLIEQPSTVALSLVVIIYAVKEGYELFKWWKSRADDYHGNRKADEDFHEKVREIASTTQEHTETLKKIGEAIAGINDRLDKSEKRWERELAMMEERRKKDMVAIGRTALLNLYEALKDKDTLTVMEYESFEEIAERYLEAGGNSVFRDKLIPNIRAKHIDSDGR